MSVPSLASHVADQGREVLLKLAQVERDVALVELGSVVVLHALGDLRRELGFLEGCNQVHDHRLDLGELVLHVDALLALQHDLLLEGLALIAHLPDALVQLSVVQRRKGLVALDVPVDR